MSIIIKDILDRCPKDKEPAWESKCESCEFSSTTWKVDKKNKPLSRKMRCLYKATKEAV